MVAFIYFHYFQVVLIFFQLIFTKTCEVLTIQRLVLCVLKVRKFVYTNALYIFVKLHADLNYDKYEFITFTVIVYLSPDLFTVFVKLSIIFKRIQGSFEEKSNYVIDFEIITYLIITYLFV